MNALGERGVPLYFLTDPIDDAGVPSWAVLLAMGMVLFFALVFFVFPVAKASVTVETTPGTKVIVSYAEERLIETAETGTAVFSVPLGSGATITLSRNGCETETIELMVLDSYRLEKQLQCV